MGDVYRAHDTVLGRDVAIKILPEAFSDDPARLLRFEQEAQFLASLSHPNVAAIYGVHESGAFAVSCSSWWTAKRCPSESREGQSHCSTRYGSRGRSATVSTRHISAESCIAT